MAPCAARTGPRRSRNPWIYQRHGLAVSNKGECLRENVNPSRANRLHSVRGKSRLRRRSLRLENHKQERPSRCGHCHRSLRKFFFVWKARCPPLADRTTSAWLPTKTSLSSPKPIFKIRNTHTCFYRPRLLEQAALGVDLIPINIILPAAGIIMRRRGNFYGAPLRAWKIPRMAARLMRARSIGVHILRPDVLQTYRQGWQRRSA